MLRLGQTKLDLDEAVAGDAEEDGEKEGATEQQMKTSLMSVLRKQFEDLDDKDTPAPNAA